MVWCILLFHSIIYRLKALDLILVVFPAHSCHFCSEQSHNSPQIGCGVDHPTVLTGRLNISVIACAFRWWAGVWGWTDRCSGDERWGGACPTAAADGAGSRIFPLRPHVVPHKQSSPINEYSAWTVTHSMWHSSMTILSIFYCIKDFSAMDCSLWPQRTPISF